MDLQEAFDHGFEAVKTYVDAELGALSDRITALEARPIEKGDTGETGPVGEKGERGDKGDTGRDGRDAADLALLKNWVTEEAIKQLSETEVTSPDNGRTLLVGLGGRVHEIKTGIPLDAGVWVERNYAAGDAVSHGGSLFIAQVETAAKPGKSDYWRLAVTRGSDGRDYRAEEKRQLEPVRFK
jgi:integrin beta 3